MFNPTALYIVLAAFAATVLVTWALRHFSSLLEIGYDKDEGVQKFHTQTTSRLGGLGLLVGLCLGIGLSVHQLPEVASIGGWLLIACIPVFAGGLIEDLTHRVSPGLRLTLATCSALFVLYVLKIGVSRTDIAWIDYLLQYPVFYYATTLLVVSGFINATNIIDGFHGLASGTIAIMILAMGILAYTAQDWTMVNLCALTLAVTLGFFVWNWPFGKIFLGDAGAYLLGFWTVQLGLLIVHRNTNISPMAPVLIGLYPLVETLFSMYRRKFIRSHPMGHPDSLHLHTLVYRRLILNPATDTTDEKRNLANAKVAPALWLLTLINGLAAALLAADTQSLIVFGVLSALLYLYLYKSLVRFNIALWLLSARH